MSFIDSSSNVILQIGKKEGEIKTFDIGQHDYIIGGKAGAPCAYFQYFDFKVMRVPEKFVQLLLSLK